MTQNINLSDNEQSLRYGKIGPLFRRYAIPGAISLLFMGMQTIVDGIILGNFVGANALASLSIILPCYSLIVAISIILGIGCQSIVSICLGEQNYQGANNALYSAFSTLLSFSFIVSVLIYVFAFEISSFLGANDILLKGSVDYLRTTMFFFPIIAAMFFSDHILKALGRPVFSMIIMTCTIVLNIVLDIVFVAFWDWGIKGAAFATGIACSIGAVFNVPIILRKSSLVSFFKGRFEPKLVWKMFYNGSSEGISELSSGISTLLFNITLIKYLGELGVAAFTAINYVFFIGITVFLGISGGIIPIISYNFGAKLVDRVKKILFLAAKTNFIIGISLCILLIFFGKEVISLFFDSSETEVLNIASEATTIYAFAFLVNGLNILVSGYFTAMANAKLSIVISILRGLFFISIGIFVFPNFWGIEGIWFAVPFAEFMTFLISVKLVRSSLRKQKYA